MNTQAKESLVSTGDGAFISLSQQIDHMLDHIDFFLTRYKPSEAASDDGMAHKHEQLEVMLRTLGTLPTQLGDVIRRWKHDEPRILSRLGVELELLNEIWITLEVLMMFFVQHGMDMHPYNRDKAEKAMQGLVRINKAIE